LLYVEDVQLVRQACTTVSVAFDDTAVAEFFDEQVDGGRRPEEFGRIWVHSHPGESAQPSWVDEETFDRVFASCDWAVMFIVARGGATYCRPRFSTGPGGSFRIPVEIDFERGFSATDFDAWSREYAVNVRPLETLYPSVAQITTRSSQSERIAPEDAFDDFWVSDEPRKETLFDGRSL
jgi:proteasome lid subunit RPN8/RPN11